MPRVTKVMLEEDIRILHDENRRLREETWRLKEVNEILKTKQFGVDAFCRMHSESVSSISHVVSDLRQLLPRGRQGKE